MKHTREMKERMKERKNKNTKDEKAEERENERTRERDNETTKVYLLSGTLCQICNISIPWQNV